MIKMLKYFNIIQKRQIKDKLGFLTKRRINPYNPLSYVALLLILIIGILMFGFVGFWKETDGTNPFKWN